MEASLADLGVRGAWEGNPFESKRWLELQRRVLPSAELRALRSSDRVMAFFEALFGEPPLVERGDVCRVVWPGDPPTRPHQDHWYVGGSPEVWTLWFPLTPCPVEAGPLAVIAGSHRGPLLPHVGTGAGSQGCAPSPDSQWSAVDVAVGDAVVFNCMTVHRSLPNLRTARPRVSVDCRYQPHSEPIHTARVDGTDARAAG